MPKILQYISMNFFKFLQMSLCFSILIVPGSVLGQDENSVREFIHFSPAYHIDQIYKSMKGPASTEKIYIHKSETPELLWITSMHAQMVNAVDQSPAKPDFMCHTNLDLDKTQLNAESNQFTRQMGRIVTLSQGQIVMDLPKGFGLPVYSDEPLLLETQVLNLNIEDVNADIKHKITIKYARDNELEEAIIPLFTVGAQGMVLVEGNNPYFEIDEANPDFHGPGCSLGETASDVKYHDPETGSKFTGHWVLKPGKEVNSTSVTAFMNLPYDTTLHYVEVHVHPFVQHLELIDRTAGTTVFKSFGKHFKDRLGLEKVDHFTSIEGVPVYKDHEYELVSTYNNTTDQDHDAMAHMVLFLRDKYYQKNN